MSTARLRLQEKSDKLSWLSFVPVVLFCAILFLAPLFPDVKLTRPKLLLLETGLYGILLLWAGLNFLRSSISIRLSLFLLPLAVYGVAETIFFYFSPDKPIALSEFKRCTLSISAYLVASSVITSGKHRSAAFASLMGGSFLAILYGLLQHSGGIGILQVPRMERVMSTFGNPIFFAAHIVIVLPLALGLFLASGKKWVRSGLAAFILCALAALYFTKTRAAFIGLGASLIVFFLLCVKSRKSLFILLGTLIIAAGIFAVSTKDIWNRQQAHLLIWRDTLVMWAQHPFNGTGTGTFHIYFPQYASDELRAIWPQEQFIINDAHNEYIQYLAETGVIGFGIFLWLIITFFALALRLLKSTDRPGSFILAGLISSAAAILTQNLFSVDMRFIISSVYLFIVMGLADTFSSDFRKKSLPHAAGFTGVVAVLACTAFVFPKVLEPYLAQKKVASTPDFFDVTVMEPLKTISDLETLANKHPEQALVFEKLGWVYAKEKNWEKAIDNLERAAELDPRAAGPLNNLGNIYYLQGNRPMAIGYWNRSLEINPSQVDSRLNLALAYYYQGQLKEAAEQLKEVLKTDPKNEKAIVMLKQMTE